VPYETHKGGPHEQLTPLVQKIIDDNLGVYEVRKVYKQLRREGHLAPRCQVEQLMRELGLVGAVRGKVKRSTIPATAGRPEELVQRQFAAPAPNRLWVADLTYVATWSGWDYVAFVMNVCSPPDRRLALLHLTRHSSRR
jgi:putative transposase